MEEKQNLEHKVIEHDYDKNMKLVKEKRKEIRYEKERWKTKKTKHAYSKRKKRADFNERNL